MTKAEIAETLRLHAEWLADNSLGKSADLSGANLSGANLSGANLSGINLSGADLSGANLSGADLFGANLSAVDLSGADLSGVSLSGANLSGANLSGANLSAVDLFGANLSAVDLSGANLSGANLSGANLSRAELSKTILDPENKPNGDAESFELSKSAEWVLGYRTRATSAGGLRLQDDRIYGTDIFSTSDDECHPGWYLWPTLKQSQDFLKQGPYIKVKARKIDIHKAGTKWRSRAIWVIGEAQ